ncbi:STAS domain-containing protein [Okeania sp.]|uniref:STAS domain-containing protein n=1 Tax=Okeania sp. TaxID=3100323 RepID=UPI002B4B4E7B|nr:STAS domain-containing protein [Okeania sp.]MEB3342767.1 STAS domain-containing protein [Okeania sp.]
MKILDNNNYLIFTPQHSLNLAEADKMKNKFISLLGKGCNLWIIDMKNVQFIDSSGLSALIIGFKIAREHGYRLVICNLSPTVKLAFEITQLDRVFQIFNNLDDVFSEYELELATA